MVESANSALRFMRFLALCWSLRREARFVFGCRVEESVNRAEERTNRAEERASCVEGLGTRSASCAEGRISSGVPEAQLMRGEGDQSIGAQCTTDAGWGARSAGTQSASARSVADEVGRLKRGR